MEKYEEILTRMEEAYEKESGHRAEDVSDTGLRLRVLAGELARVQAEIDWVSRQAFPQTAQGEWLDRHGKQRGVTRKAAARAKGTVTFSRYLPLSFDVVIPKGTVCAIPGESPVEYETLREAVLAAGELSVEVPAQAAVGGADGNASAGHINALSSALIGVDYVTNKSAFTGGRNQETDEEYRVRVLDAYANLPNGSNAAYYRDVALAFEGISAAGVKPRANGANTVALYVWGQDAAPDSGTLAALQDELNRRREIGVTVSVQTAAALPVNVGVRVRLQEGAEFSQAKADITAAIKSYFDGLTVGSPVYRSEVEKAILTAAPVAEWELATGMRDLAGDPGKIPVAGTISVEEIA